MAGGREARSSGPRIDLQVRGREEDPGVHGRVATLEGQPGTVREEEGEIKGYVCSMSTCEGEIKMEVWAYPPVRHVSLYHRVPRPEKENPDGFSPGSRK